MISRIRLFFNVAAVRFVIEADQAGKVNVTLASSGKPLVTVDMSESPVGDAAYKVTRAVESHCSQYVLDGGNDAHVSGLQILAMLDVFYKTR